MAVNRSLLVLLALTVVAACGNEVDEAGPAVTIGPSGGLVVISSGPLAGAVLEIPAGALDASVLVSLGSGTSEPTPGFLVGGAAASAFPTNARLNVPATLTLPWGPQGFVVGTTLLPEEDVVLFQRDANGAVAQLVTGRVDRAAETVSAQIDRLGDFWPALRPSALDFDLARFLPADGDSVEFADGSVLQVELRTDEIGLEGESILRLEFADPFRRRLQVAPDAGGLELRGLWEEPRPLTPGFRVRTDGAVPFLPDRMVERTVVDEPVTYDVFPGFVAGSPSVAQAGSMRLSFGRRTAVQTPERTFVEVLDVLIQWDFGASGPRQLGLLLARNEGVVGYAWDGDPVVLRSGRRGARR